MTSVSIRTKKEIKDYLVRTGKIFKQINLHGKSRASIVDKEVVDKTVMPAKIKKNCKRCPPYRLEFDAEVGVEKTKKELRYCFYFNYDNTPGFWTVDTNLLTELAYLYMEVFNSYQKMLHLKTVRNCYITGKSKASEALKRQCRSREQYYYNAKLIALKKMKAVIHANQSKIHFTDSLFAGNLWELLNTV